MPTRSGPQRWGCPSCETPQRQSRVALSRTGSGQGIRGGFISPPDPKQGSSHSRKSPNNAPSYRGSESTEGIEPCPMPTP